MYLDPMGMKKNMIENSIKDLESKDKKKKLSSIEFLSATIGIGDDFGLENNVIDALSKLSLTEKSRRIKKLAANAEQEIKNRLSKKSNTVNDMLSQFSGGVIISSKNDSKKK